MPKLELLAAETGGRPQFCSRVMWFVPSARHDLALACTPISLPSFAR